MLEEPTKQAVGAILSQGLLGALLIMSWILFAFTLRWLNSQNKDMKAERDAEIAAHKETVKTQMTDIRNLANVAASVDNLRPMIELLLKQRDTR